MKPSHAAQLVLLGVIWGSSYLFIKVAVAGVPPVTLVAGRLVVGAAVLVLALRWRGLRLARGGRAWLHVAVQALVGIVFPFLLIAWGEERIDSSLASILNATTPFFTLLFAVAALRSERLGLGRVAGLALGFAGVAVLTGKGLADLGSGSAQGEIALLLSSVCYGLGFAYARRFLRGDPITLAASQSLVAAAVVVPLALVAGDPGATRLDAERLGAWLALGVLSSGVAYILYYRLIAAVGATTASFSTYLMPIVGLLWGWLLLGEPLGPRTLAGVALILIGLVVASLRRPALRAERAAPALGAAADPPLPTCGRD